jgi:hypothetical protein
LHRSTRGRGPDDRQLDRCRRLGPGRGQLHWHGHVTGRQVESANTCGFTAPGDQRNTNPRLAPLAANRAANQTQALAATSPAIDAANPAHCTAADERGVVRPQDSACDSGAYEFDRVPANTTAPSITGDPHVGRTLTCSTGTWVDDTSRTIRWLRGGAPIGGATASSYTTTDADAGTGVQCEVTARNPIGATVATSAPSSQSPTPRPAAGAARAPPRPPPPTPSARRSSAV